MSESSNKAPIHKVVAENIHRLLRKKGWNKSELARRADAFMPEGQSFGKYNVTSYTTGRSLPNPVFLEAMAKAFGVETTEILPDRGYDDAVSPSRRSATPRTFYGNNAVLLNINQWVSPSTAQQVLALLAAEEKGET